MAGRLAGRPTGRQNNFGWIFSKFLKFSTGKSIWIFNSLQNVIIVLPMHFSWRFSSKIYFKVCIEVHKI